MLQKYVGALPIRAVGSDHSGDSGAVRQGMRSGELPERTAAAVLRAGHVAVVEHPTPAQKAGAASAEAKRQSDWRRAGGNKILAGRVSSSE